ncbi:MAG: hypothetical protein B7Z53_06185, partial [Rhodospirillales bacterium 12-71-4]
MEPAPAREAGALEAVARIHNLPAPDQPGRGFIRIDLPVPPLRILTVLLPRERLVRLVAPRRLADGQTGVIFDREMRLVARSGEDADLIGQKAGPAFLQAVQQAAEGALPGVVRNPRGAPVLVAFVRAEVSGYTAGASLPAAFAAPYRATLW